MLFASIKLRFINSGKSGRCERRVVQIIIIVQRKLFDFREPSKNGQIKLGLLRRENGPGQGDAKHDTAIVLAKHPLLPRLALRLLLRKHGPRRTGSRGQHESVRTLGFLTYAYRPIRKVDNRAPAFERLYGHMPIVLPLGVQPRVQRRLR